MDMTHFVCLVIGENVEEQLAPYDESIEVEPYRRYVEKEMLSRYKERLPDYRDLDIENHEQTAKFLNERDGSEDYQFDEKGVYRMSTHNPQSKWDWYDVGGRWSGFLPLKDGGEANVATIKEINLSALVIPTAVIGEGVFDQVGEIGWFGYVDHSNKEEWEQRIRNVIMGLPPETKVTVVDCHI